MKERILSARMRQWKNEKSQDRLRDLFDGFERDQIRQCKLEKLLAYRVEQRKLLLKELLLKQINVDERLKRSRVYTRRTRQQQV